jgi:hypothetical protein
LSQLTATERTELAEAYSARMAIAANPQVDSLPAMRHYMVTLNRIITAHGFDVMRGVRMRWGEDTNFVLEAYRRPKEPLSDSKESN